MDSFKKSLGSTMGKLVACGGCFIIFIIVIIIIIAASSAGTKSTIYPSSEPAKADNSTTQSTSQATTVQTTPQVLLDVAGSGTKSTQKFTAAGDWDLDWSYDCSKFGQQGNFQVMIYQGDGTLSVDNAMVNELGMQGTDVEHYHTGGTFYLTVNSECSWHLTAKG